MWLIKTSHGYKLEDEVGNYLKFFTMTCDSKAWCVSENISTTYLTRKSEQSTMDSYKQATGKTLLF